MRRISGMSNSTVVKQRYKPDTNHANTLMRNHLQKHQSPRGVSAHMFVAPLAHCGPRITHIPIV